MLATARTTIRTWIRANPITAFYFLPTVALLLTSYALVVHPAYYVSVMGVLVVVPAVRRIVTLSEENARLRRERDAWQAAMDDVTGKLRDAAHRASA